MRTVTLTRGPSTSEGTFGLVAVEGSPFTCVSGELPWKDNAPDISCVPAGSYVCKRQPSPKHGPCFHLQNVSGRTQCEIHAANLMGDVSAGYVSQLEGCIALGERVSVFAAGIPPAGKLAQRGITNSRNTLIAFEAIMGIDDFLLQIKEAS